jgi:hypothetical protein
VHHDDGGPAGRRTARPFDAGRQRRRKANGLRGVVLEQVDDTGADQHATGQDRDDAQQGKCSPKLLGLITGPHGTFVWMALTRFGLGTGWGAREVEPVRSC